MGMGMLVGLSSDVFSEKRELTPAELRKRQKKRLDTINSDISFLQRFHKRNQELLNKQKQGYILVKNKIFYDGESASTKVIDAYPRDFLINQITLDVFTGEIPPEKLMGITKHFMGESERLQAELEETVQKDKEELEKLKKEKEELEKLLGEEESADGSGTLSGTGAVTAGEGISVPLSISIDSQTKRFSGKLSLVKPDGRGNTGYIEGKCSGRYKETNEGKVLDGQFEWHASALLKSGKRMDMGIHKGVVKGTLKEGKVQGTFTFPTGEKIPFQATVK